MDKKEYLIIKNLTCGYMGGFKLEPVNLVLKRGCFAGVIDVTDPEKVPFSKDSQAS